MIQPDELKKDEPLTWSPGRGADVWALFNACIAGDLAAVERLVAKDPSLVRSHYAYRKPLYFAVRENRIDVARFLLERDTDPVDLWVDDSPLEIARDRGSSAMLEMLETTLATKFNASPRGEPVAAALRAHDLPAARRLLDEDPPLLHAGDQRSNQPIHWAVMTRQLQAIDELLARGASIDARRMDGARPIHVTNGDYFYRGWRDVPKGWSVSPADVMAHLRACGAFVDLNTAVHTGDIARVRELLAQDPTLANRVGDHGGYYLGSGTPLQNAAATGRMEIVTLLLEHGADPNLREEQIAPRGRALYAAVYGGHFEIAKLLLAKGASWDQPVESSADPLSIAMTNKDRRMIDLLRAHGAKLDTELQAWVDKRYEAIDSGPNWLHITPLHHAARDGNVKKAALLIELGADLHARDEHNRSTPLGWAAKFGRKDMVKLLLARGAKHHLPDDPPWATPLAWATRRGHPDIVKLLQRHGATA